MPARFAVPSACITFYSDVDIEEYHRGNIYTQFHQTSGLSKTKCSQLSLPLT